MCTCTLLSGNRPNCKIILPQLYRFDLKKNVLVQRKHGRLVELLIAVINSRADEHIISSKAIKFSRSAYPSKSFVVILDFFANTLCNLFTDFEKLLISFSKAFDATFTYPSAGFPLVGLSFASSKIIFTQFKEKIAYFWTAYRYDSLKILNSKNI